MKRYTLLYIIVSLLLISYPAFGEEWYERGEASSVASDYVGSINKQITEVSDGSAYMPEYNLKALHMIESSNVSLQEESGATEAGGVEHDVVSGTPMEVPGGQEQSSSGGGQRP